MWTNWTILANWANVTNLAIFCQTYANYLNTEAIHVDLANFHEIGESDESEEFGWI